MDDLLINKIFENINRNDIYPGCIIASISKQMPNYYFHWTRDAALVMRVIIKHHQKREDLRCFKQMINYINVESKFQNLETQGGLGEPKYNVNITSFNDDGKIVIGSSSCWTLTSHFILAICACPALFVFFARFKTLRSA